MTRSFRQHTGKAYYKCSTFRMLLHGQIPSIPLLQVIDSVICGLSLTTCVCNAFSISTTGLCTFVCQQWQQRRSMHALGMSLWIGCIFPSLPVPALFGRLELLQSASSLAKPACFVGLCEIDIAGMLSSYDASTVLQHEAYEPDNAIMHDSYFPKRTVQFRQDTILFGLMPCQDHVWPLSRYNFTCQ